MNNEIIVKPLSISVRGSEGIDFREGWATGDMTEGGVEISTVYCAKTKQRFGGCIDRGQAIEIRDFLNNCISKWESESPKAT